MKCIGLEFNPKFELDRQLALKSVNSINYWAVPKALGSYPATIVW